MNLLLRQPLKRRTIVSEQFELLKRQIARLSQGNQGEFARGMLLDKLVDSCTVVSVWCSPVVVTLKHFSVSTFYFTITHKDLGGELCFV